MIKDISKREDIEWFGRFGYKGLEKKTAVLYAKEICCRFNCHVVFYFR